MALLRSRMQRRSIPDVENLPDTTAEDATPRSAAERTKTRDALAALPPLEQRIQKAIALWHAGWSLRGASDQCGVAATTVHKRLAKDREAHEGERMKVRALIEPLSLDIAREAGRQTLEQLHDGTASKTQIPIIYGIAVDKLQRLGSMDAASDSPISQLFELLHQGGRLTVEGPDGAQASVEGDPNSGDDRPHDRAPGADE